MQISDETSWQPCLQEGISSASFCTYFHNLSNLRTLHGQKVQTIFEMARQPPCQVSLSMAPPSCSLGAIKLSC